MSSRPSKFKKGGGFLNNVDALITDYSFVVGDTVEIKKGARKGEDFTPLSLVPTFRPDGSDEDVEIRLLIGDASNFGEVSDDGKTLFTPDGQSFFASCEAAVFMNSLCNPEEGDGFPEDRFADSDDEINYAPMIGTRVRLVRPIITGDRAKKQTNKTTGKEYDARELKVGAVYSLPDVKKGGKSTAKVTAPAAGKKGKPAEVDVAEVATDALTRYLSATKDKALPKSKVRMKVLTDPEFKSNTDLRDLVEAYLLDDDNLENMDGIEFSRKDKSQGITLLEAVEA